MSNFISQLIVVHIYRYFLSMSTTNMNTEEL
jgi:hypothetical protein